MAEVWSGHYEFLARQWRNLVERQLRIFRADTAGVLYYGFLERIQLVF